MMVRSDFHVEHTEHRACLITINSVKTKLHQRRTGGGLGCGCWAGTQDRQGQGGNEGGRSQGGIPSRKARPQAHGGVKGGTSHGRGLAAGTRGRLTEMELLAVET